MLGGDADAIDTTGDSGPVAFRTRRLDAADPRRPSWRPAITIDGGGWVNEDVAVESLRRCALFAHVREEVIRDLGRQMRRRKFRRNEVIFHQGDPGESLHVVASGAVKIVLPSAEGEEAIIATLREGDFFGELALLDGAPRSATAVALDASETLSLPRTTFRDMLDRDAELRDALLAG